MDAVYLKYIAVAWLAMLIALCLYYLLTTRPPSWLMPPDGDGKKFFDNPNHHRPDTWQQYETPTIVLSWAMPTIIFFTFYPEFHTAFAVHTASSLFYPGTIGVRADIRYARIWLFAMNASYRFTWTVLTAYITSKTQLWYNRADYVPADEFFGILVVIGVLVPLLLFVWVGLDASSLFYY